VFTDPCLSGTPFGGHFGFGGSQSQDPQDYTDDEMKDYVVLQKPQEQVRHLPVPEYWTSR
jgi:hypothetical protein